MKNHVRRAIAFVAAKALSGSENSALYDYNQSAYFQFGGTVNDATVSIFDYDQGCYVSGNLPSLFHYGEGQHIQLILGEDQFRGFDYGSGNHFSGSVNGFLISLYDYEFGQYFNYSM